MANRELEIVISAQNEAKKVFDKLEKQMKGLSKTSKKISKSIVSSFNSIWKSITKNLVKWTKIAGIALAWLWWIWLKLAGDFEQTRIAFETMLWDWKKAGDLLQELSEFAEKTPFEFPEIAKAGKSLLAFWIQAKKIQPTLKTLWDLSSSLNIPIWELSELYGKAKVQGRLFMEDINQLTWRWIPVIAEFAKQFWVAESEIRDLVSDWKIWFSDLQIAMENMTSEWWQFAWWMANQSQSLNWLLSTAKDNISNIFRELIWINNRWEITAWSILEKTKEAVKWVSEFLVENKDNIKAWAEVIMNTVWVIFTWISNLFDLLQPLVLEWLSIIKDFWTEHWEDIMTIVTFLWNRIKAITETLFRVLWPIIKNAFAIIWDIFSIFWKLIKWDWAWLWESLKSLWVNFSVLIVNLVKWLFETLFSLFTGQSKSLWEIWGEMWTNIKDIIKINKILILRKIKELIEDIKAFFLWLPAKAKQWWSDMIQWFIDGIKSKVEDAKQWWKNAWNMFKDWLQSTGDNIKWAAKWIATDISDYLWFGSPTKKWPWAKSDKWMPNLTNMLAQGLNTWRTEIEKSALKISTVMWTIFWKNLWIEKTKELLSKLQGVFKWAFSELNTSIDTSKTKISWLNDEIKWLKKSFADLWWKMIDIEDSGRASAAKRVLELEKEILALNEKKVTTWLSKEEGTDLIDKEKELLLATEFAWVKAIEDLKVENAKSETERIIETTRQKLNETQIERTKIQEELQVKLEALSSEEEAHKALKDKRIEFENEYFNLFQENITTVKAELNKAIALMNRLNKIKSVSWSQVDSVISGARAKWWPVWAWKTYMVWEQGPELFTPSSSWSITSNDKLWGANININLWGVVINNESDENSLISKIEESLTRTLQLNKMGIS